MRRGSRGGRVVPDDGMPRAELPPEPRPGDHVGSISLDLYGMHFCVPLRVPGAANGRRARSDQYAVEVEGAWRKMSLREALLELDRMAPRVLTRKERVAL